MFVLGGLKLQKVRAECDIVRPESAKEGRGGDAWETSLQSFEGNQGGPKKGGLNIARHEGWSMQRNESETRSNQLLLTTPIPWDPLSSL